MNRIHAHALDRPFLESETSPQPSHDGKPSREGLGERIDISIRLGAAPKSPSTLAATASRASPAQSMSADPSAPSGRPWTKRLPCSTAESIPNARSRGAMDWSSLSSPSVSSPRPPSSEHPRALAASTAKMGTSSMARAAPRRPSSSPRARRAKRKRCPLVRRGDARAPRHHLGSHFAQQVEPTGARQIEPGVPCADATAGDQRRRCRAPAPPKNHRGPRTKRLGASPPNARHLAREWAPPWPVAPRAPERGARGDRARRGARARK